MTQCLSHLLYALLIFRRQKNREISLLVSATLLFHAQTSFDRNKSSLKEDKDGAGR